MPDVTEEATGPNGAAVAFDATATDTMVPTPAVQCTKGSDPAVPVSSGETFPLGTTTVTCTATDAAGNEATDSFDVTVRDTTPPTLHDFFSSGLGYRVYATSSSGATVDYLPLLPDANSVLTATDLVDGEIRVKCTPTSGSTLPLGANGVWCTATDAAGNVNYGHLYLDITYDWSGMLQPVNADGSSVFRLGATVPVKFALVGESGGIEDASATFTYHKIDSDIDGTVMEDASTATPTTGARFRYDTKSEQYVFNWNTKGLMVGTYLLLIDLGDGTPREAVISLKK